MLPYRAMCELYRGLVTREFSVDHYRQFFALLLAQTDGTLLYHCTAGKDRVGVGTMLLLTALGVDWPVIVENYLIRLRVPCVRPSSADRRDPARSARRAADSAQRSKSFFPFCSVTSATWSIVMPLISATRAAMNGRLRESLRLPRFGTGAR